MEVDHGFKQLEEEYFAMLEGRATRHVAGEVADEEGNVPTELVPFELNRESIFDYICEHGYTGKYEDFSLAVDLLREEKKNNRPVKVGIRPEAFSMTPVATKGIIPIDIYYIEHKGRDISIIGTVHGQQDKAKVRVIIPAEERVNVLGKEKVDLYAKRFYVFENSGARIK